MCTTTHHTFSPCRDQHLHTHTRAPCQSRLPFPHAYYPSPSTAPHREETVSLADPGYPCPTCTRAQQSQSQPQPQPQSQFQDGDEKEIIDGVRLLWPRENQRGGFGESLLLGAGRWVPEALGRERAFPYPAAEPAGFGERNRWLPALAPEPKHIRDQTSILRLEREVWDTTTAEQSSSSRGIPAVAADTLAKESSPSPVRHQEHVNQARENIPGASRRIEELDAFAYQLEPTLHQQPRRDVLSHQPSPLISTALRGNVSDRGGPQRPATSPFTPMHQSQDVVQRLRDEYRSQYQPNTGRMVAARDQSTSHIRQPDSRQLRTHRVHKERLRRHLREEHQSFLQRHLSSTQEPGERSQSSEALQPFNFNPQTGDRGEFIPGAGRWVSDRRSRLQRQREDVMWQPSQPSSQLDGSAEERSVE